MSIVQDLISDLREKRLWPVAVALLVALVAVPVVLSSGSNSGVPVAQIPPAPGPSASVPGLPAVSVTPTPSNARLTGRQRNPFTQQVKKSSSVRPGGSSTSSTPPLASNGSGKGSSGSSSSGSSKSSTVSGSVGGGSTTVPSTTPTATTPAATPPPAPTTLSATQAYHVTLSLTNSAGGADTVDPVQRLSLIPSRNLPLLVELGVLHGGHRVLFAVEPGTVVQGPGRCTPGPIDCEIISLAPNQIEGVATTEASGAVTGALMAVTAIKADKYSSSGAADRARQAESAAGRRLLSLTKLSALSLFPYRPSLGALVDLSNVTVGGS
jgi:hypothetical protein